MELSPDKFVEAVAGRIYTEWCMSPESKGVDPCYGYHGQGFENFVRAEMHYRSERLAKVGAQNVWEPANQEQIRNEILAALVRRAVQFFRETDGKTNRLEDKVNLRCDLRPWMTTLRLGCA